MKNTKLWIGVALLAMVGIVASLGMVSAYRGDMTLEGPNFDEERHELMTEAFEDVDYDAWEALMTEDEHQGRILELVNEENFEVFVESHNAALDGNFDLANELREELGLHNGQGPHDGTGRGMHEGSNGEGRGQGQGMGQGKHSGQRDCQV